MKLKFDANLPYQQEAIQSAVGVFEGQPSNQSQFEVSFTTQMDMLEHAVYVRNLCAHHSRLWNRRFTITVALPKNRPNSLVESLNPAADRRVYNTLTLLAHIVNIVEPENHWKDRMKSLLEDQNIPVTEHMGFPDNWKDSPLWQEE